MTEATAAGAAFLAGVAVGLWQASDPPSAFGELDRVFEPSMSVDEREQRMAQWQRAVQRSLGWSQ
jgi:glycerol kinase